MNYQCQKSSQQKITFRADSQRKFKYVLTKEKPFKLSCLLFTADSWKLWVAFKYLKWLKTFSNPKHTLAHTWQLRRLKTEDGELRDTFIRLNCWTKEDDVTNEEVRSEENKTFPPWHWTHRDSFRVVLSAPASKHSLNLKKRKEITTRPLPVWHGCSSV